MVQTRLTVRLDTGPWGRPWRGLAPPHLPAKRSGLMVFEQFIRYAGLVVGLT